MNESTLIQLKIMVERAVRPVRASISHKRKMREELLAHVSDVFEEEARLGDGPAAFTLVPRPFNLQVHVPQHAPGELFYWISDGVASTAMPAWGAVDETTGKPKLSETERWEIIRYLQGLAAGEYPQ